MSRGHQIRRRRTYGRRRHEVRERRLMASDELGWQGADEELEWAVGEADDNRSGHGGTPEGYRP
jgi:hypothetical protein